MEVHVCIVMFLGLFLENPHGTILSHYPFGPMMCKNLCTQTGSCHSYVFEPSSLLCNVWNYIPGKGAITFESLVGPCPENTRLHRGRKGKQLCLSDTTPTHIDHDLLLFPNQAVHIDAPRQLHLGSMETTLLKGTELEDTHVQFVIFASCVKTLFVSRGIYDNFTLEAWTWPLQREVLYQTSSSSLLTVDDTKRLLFIKAKRDTMVRIVSIPRRHEFNDSGMSELYIKDPYRVSSILAVPEVGRLYAATAQEIYSIPYNGGYMKLFSKLWGDIGFLSLGCNDDFIYYSQSHKLRRISRTSKKVESFGDFGHIPKNLVCNEDKLYMNLEHMSRIITLFPEEDITSQGEIQTPMNVPFVMCLL